MHKSQIHSPLKGFFKTVVFIITSHFSPRWQIVIRTLKERIMIDIVNYSPTLWFLDCNITHDPYLNWTITKVGWEFHFKKFFLIWKSIKPWKTIIKLCFFLLSYTIFEVFWYPSITIGKLKITPNVFVIGELAVSIGCYLTSVLLYIFIHSACGYIMNMKLILKTMKRFWSAKPLSAHIIMGTLAKHLFLMSLGHNLYSWLRQCVTLKVAFQKLLLNNIDINLCFVVRNIVFVVNSSTWG